MSRVTVLGMGAMGQRIARNLLKAGHEVVVWNRTPAAAAELASHGARQAGSAAEAVAGSQFVIAMLTDDMASRAVWLEAGALAAMDSGALAIEVSTLTPDWVRELGAAAAARGVTLVDAPVMGSRPQADAGQLIHLAGGEPAAVDRASALLAPISGAFIHVGKAGDGAVMKLMANTLFACQAVVLGECLGMVARAGIPLEHAIDTLSALPVMSPAAKGLAGLMAKGAHAPLFPVRLVEKDLRYVAELAAGLGAGSPMSSLARELFALMMRHGKGDENISSVHTIFV